MEVRSETGAHEADANGLLSHDGTSLGGGESRGPFGSIKAHPQRRPEDGCGPEGLLKLVEAVGAAPALHQPVELHDRPVDLPIFLSGVHLNPVPVGVAVPLGLRAGRQGLGRSPRNHARGEGDLQVEDIPARPRSSTNRVYAMQAGSSGTEAIAASSSPHPAQYVVWSHLPVDQGGERGRRRAHVLQGLGFVDGEAVGAAEMNQEEVVLSQIMPESRFRKRAVAEPRRRVETEAQSSAQPSIRRAHAVGHKQRRIGHGGRFRSAPRAE